MIDTIRAYLILNPQTNPIPVSEFQYRLDSFKYTESIKSVGYLNGSLKNIQISIQYDITTKLAYKITVTGSVPKFIHSNNLASCFPSDIQTFIDTLHSALDIDMNDAVVTWLDFGLNFFVKRPVSDYIASIQSYPRLRKSGYEKETVTFQTKSKNKVIIFYDKIKEIKSKSRNPWSAIPNELSDINVLRYEIRYRKQPHKQFKKNAHIRLKHLKKKYFHKKLLSHLKDTFNEVIFSDLQYPSADLISSSGFLKTYLSLVGLSVYGMDNVDHIIQSQYFDVKNPSVKRSTLRKQLKELAQLSNELHSTNVKSALEAKFDVLECIYFFDN